jgi:integrase
MNSERTLDVGSPEAWAESQVEAVATALERGESTPRRPRGSGRIFQRSGSACWWIAYCHRGTERRESSGSEDPKQAEKLLRYRLKEVAADQLGARPFVGPAAERLRVGDLLDALEAHHKLQGTFSPQLAAHLKPIREAFGDRRALAVTADAVDTYIEAQLRAKAPATVNRETQLLHQAFTLAVARGRLAFVPTIRRLSEVGNARQGFFERADVESVVAHLPVDLQDVARFAALTGWRKGAIASLTFADLDGQAIRLRAEHDKTRRGQVLPLEGELAAIIERRKAVRQVPRPDGTVALAAFVFHRNGAPIGDFRKAWATACAAAGVAGRLFHDLRRTAVRNLTRAGVPETVAMAISGHKTRSVFDRYNIASERDLREALQRTQAHLTHERSTGVALAHAQGSI